jgi:hypothetical protein
MKAAAAAKFSDTETMAASPPKQSKSLVFPIIDNPWEIQNARESAGENKRIMCLASRSNLLLMTLGRICNFHANAARIHLPEVRVAALSERISLGKVVRPIPSGEPTLSRPSGLRFSSVVKRSIQHHRIAAVLRFVLNKAT